MNHASMAVGRKLDLIWVEAAHLENDFENEEMKSANGVVSCRPSWFWNQVRVIYIIQNDL